MTLVLRRTYPAVFARFAAARSQRLSVGLSLVAGSLALVATALVAPTCLYMQCRLRPRLPMLSFKPPTCGQRRTFEAMALAKTRQSWCQITSTTLVAMHRHCRRSSSTSSIQRKVANACLLRTSQHFIHLFLASTHSGVMANPITRSAPLPAVGVSANNSVNRTQKPLRGLCAGYLGRWAAPYR